MKQTTDILDNILYQSTMHEDAGCKCRKQSLSKGRQTEIINTINYKKL